MEIDKIIFNLIEIYTVLLFIILFMNIIEKIIMYYMKSVLELDIPNGMILMDKIINITMLTISVMLPILVLIHVILI